jgi:hypothetical protein
VNGAAALALAAGTRTPTAATAATAITGARRFRFNVMDCLRGF